MASDPTLFAISTATFVVTILTVTIRVVVFLNRHYRNVAERVAIGFQLLSALLVTANYAMTRVKINREKTHPESDSWHSAIHVRSLCYYILQINHPFVLNCRSRNQRTYLNFRYETLFTDTCIPDINRIAEVHMHQYSASVFDFHFQIFNYRLLVVGFCG